MAPLTWRNVDAPDMRGAAAMMETASRGWDSAFSGMRDAFYRQGETNRRNKSAELLPIMANVTDQAGAEAAIAAFSRLAPHQVSPELADAMMGLRGQAQEFQANELALRNARRGGSGGAAAARDARNAPMELAAAAARANLTPEGSPAGTPAPTAPGTPVAPAASAAPVAAPMPAAQDFVAAQAGSMTAPGSPSLSFDTAVAPIVAQATQPAAAPSAMADIPVTFGGRNFNVPAAVSDGPVSAPVGAPRVAPAAPATPAYNPGIIPTGSGITPPPNVSGTDVGSRIDAANQGILAAAIGSRADMGDTLTAMDKTQDSMIDRAEFEASMWATNFDNLTTFENYQRAEDDRQRNEAAAQFLMDNAPMFPDRESLEAAIMSDPITADMADSLMSAYDAQVARTPSYYQTPEVDPDPEIAGMKQDFEITSQQALLVNPALRLAMGDVAEANGAVDDVPSEAVNLDTWISGLRTRHPNLSGNVMDTIRKIGQETGLPMSIITEAASNQLDSRAALTPWGEPRVTIDEDGLRATLENYRTGDTYRDARLFATQMVQSSEQMDRVSSEIDDLRGQLAWYEEKIPPDEQANHQGMLAIRQEIDAKRGEFRELYNNRPQVPLTGWAQNTSSTTVAEPDSAGRARLDQMLEQSLRNAAQQGESIPTPAGRAVDPEAAPVNQATTRMMRTSEINTNLLDIQRELATSGGAIASRLIGTIADSFRPAAEGRRNSARRDLVGEALDWFKSDEAKRVFFANPQLLAEAKKDPTRFYLGRTGDPANDN